jgi:hypothetical protein
VFLPLAWCIVSLMPSLPSDLVCMVALAHRNILLRLRSHTARSSWSYVWRYCTTQSPHSISVSPVFPVVRQASDLWRGRAETLRLRWIRTYGICCSINNPLSQIDLPVLARYNMSGGLPLWECPFVDLTGQRDSYLEHRIAGFVTGFPCDGHKTSEIGGCEW